MKTLQKGDKVIIDKDFTGVVLRQYDGDMYEIRMGNGVCVVDCHDVEKVIKE